VIGGASDTSSGRFREWCGKYPRDKVVSRWRGLSGGRHIWKNISLVGDGKKRRSVLAVIMVSRQSAQPKAQIE
jgi:hypothetical protein